MSNNYDAWLTDSSAYEEYAGCGEEYEVDEDGTVKDEQYYKDLRADEEYDRQMEGFYELD